MSADMLDEDFNPEEAAHVRALIRRANWLEQRLATSGRSLSGAKYDISEYNAILWALYELGAEYAPTPYAAQLEGPGEVPPVMPAVEWRPASPAGFKTARPRRLEGTRK